MKIKEVMERPVFVSPNTTKKEIQQIIKKHPCTDILIVSNKSRKFLGDLHINDLFIMFVPNEHFNKISSAGYDFKRKFFAKNAKDLMRKHEFSCGPDDDIVETALELAETEINEFPVIDKKGKVVGVVTERLLIPYLK